jgi:hypothetical protein
MKFPPDDEDDAPPEDSAQEANTESAARLAEAAAAATAPTSSPASASASSSALPVRSSVDSSTVQKSHPMTPEIWEGLANGTSPYCCKDANGNPMAYKGIPKMSDTDKAWVQGVFDDGSFDWLPEAGELFEGSETRFVTAEKCLVDPLNGKKFE